MFIHVSHNSTKFNTLRNVLIYDFIEVILNFSNLLKYPNKPQKLLHQINCRYLRIASKISR